MIEMNWMLHVCIQVLLRSFLIMAKHRIVPEIRKPLKLKAQNYLLLWSE